MKDGSLLPLGTIRANLLQRLNGWGSVSFVVEAVRAQTLLVGYAPLPDNDFHAKFGEQEHGVNCDSFRPSQHGTSRFHGLA